MKVTSDIHLFKSNVENIDGYMPSYIDTKEILPILKRVVMKLREQNFSLENSCIVNGRTVSMQTAEQGL